MIVYRVTNTVNGKYYIGITVRTLRQRMWSHLSLARNGGGSVFHKAIRKYGEDKFTWEVIHTTSSVEELKVTEMDEIRNHNGMWTDNGYNATIGGDHTVFGDLHPRRINPDICKGDKNSFYGKHHSIETKKALSDINKGKSSGEKNYFYGKQFFGEQNSFYGRTHSDESKSIVGDKNSKNYKVTKPNGEIYYTRNLHSVCKEYGLNYSGVKSASRNGRVYKEGWFFEKIDELPSL